MPKSNDVPSDPGAVVEVRPVDAPPKKLSKAKPEPERVARLSVDTLAEQLGHRKRIRNPHPGRTIDDVAHAAAATLHGWREHRHHTGSPMALSRADYEAALRAAQAPAPGKSRIEPHGPALSPFHPHKGAPWARKD